MKARIKFKKFGALRFIGHLDVMRFFQKAMRRADIPIAFTGGYSPHMIMSFASPLGIGHSSDGEYFDIELKEEISSKEAVKRLNKVMVEGIEVLSFRQIAEEKKMTGMAILAAADYRTTLKKGLFPDDWKDKLTVFLSQPEIRILKQTKRSETEVDIKPLIFKMQNKNDCIDMQLAAGSVQNLKPGLVMEAFCDFLNIEPKTMEFYHHRLEMYADTGTGNISDFKTLEDLGWEMEMKTV
jgi:radical SAM-linked protein